MDPIQAGVSQIHHSSTPEPTSRQSSISICGVTKSNSPRSPYEKRPGTEISTTGLPASSPGRLSMHSRDSSITSTGLPTSLAASPDSGFLDSGVHDRRDSLLLLDEIVPELSMESLQHAFMYVRQKSECGIRSLADSLLFKIVRKKNEAFKDTDRQDTDILRSRDKPALPSLPSTAER